MNPKLDEVSPKLEPSLIVIFGITGDLSKRYLLPALYHLFKNELLDSNTELIGITRQNITLDELFQDIKFGTTDAKIDENDARQILKTKTSLFHMDLNNPEDYDKLLQKMNSQEEQKGICLNRLYYLSIPPQAYSSVIRLLGERNLNKSCQHDQAQTRLLVEKPFGFDLNSAQELVNTIDQSFAEQQVYRIDHYMAKETVQNILTFRFKNPIFEAIWDNKHIASIEISAKQKIGIEGRATFYEPLGALRDFIQSHLLQILGIVAMDQPEHMDSQHIHFAKQALLERLEAVPADKVAERTLRGQYEGYREEVKNPGSVTETYAEIKIFINNERWQGVPIKLITGKMLDKHETEICVTFTDKDDGSSNHLRFRIQPNEGIELDLVTKKPGYSQDVKTTAMNFSYDTEFAHDGHPNAYERVLVDAVRGDHTLFATSQEILASWRVVQPVLDVWKNKSDDLVVYKPGASAPSRHL